MWSPVHEGLHLPSQFCECFELSRLSGDGWIWLLYLAFILMLQSSGWFDAIYKHSHKRWADKSSEWLFAFRNFKSMAYHLCCCFHWWKTWRQNLILALQIFKVLQTILPHIPFIFFIQTTILAPNCIFGLSRLSRYVRLPKETVVGCSFYTFLGNQIS